MEEAVRNCVHGEVTDAVLGLIVELIVTSLQAERPLFPNPLDEPIFYRRYLKRWVEEELEQEQAIASKQEADLRELYRM
jgi:hypothetical protein